MMGKLNLTETERSLLQRLAESDNVDTAQARRAKLILMLEDGNSRDTVIRVLGCDSRFISRWSSGFMNERMPGICSRQPQRDALKPSVKSEGAILNHTIKHRPGDGSSHWSSRKLAAELGNVSPSAVLRTWRKHSLSPALIDREIATETIEAE